MSTVEITKAYWTLLNVSTLHLELGTPSALDAFCKCLCRMEFLIFAGLGLVTDLIQPIDLPMGHRYLFILGSVVCSCNIKKRQLLYFEHN